MMNRWPLLISSVLAAGCAGHGSVATTSEPAKDAGADSISALRPQYASTYHRRQNPPVLIRNATILTAAGPEQANASILFQDGKVVSVGRDLTAPAGATVIDGTGKFVTPGLIDDHSHLGVYSAPGTFAESDGNEATSPNTAQVWAEHSFWPQDPQIPLAIAGGVTVIQALPGSANLIGGRSATLRLIPARTVQEMKFPGAPYGLKMACGENPKRVYQNSGPSTRMGNMAGYREAYIRAEAYRRRWDTWLKDRKGDPPDRDLQLETLAEVLRGHILVQNHCYRADEMVQMMDLAREFGFHIRAFHHAVEAYKIADILAREGVATSVWADWWGFKMESFDGIPQSAALQQQAGVRVIIHSDDADGIQRLNDGAAQAMYSGNQAGIPVTREQAIQWITINPAWALGIDSVTGSLEPGKDADVVLWSGDPFSIYSKAELVFNDGWLLFDRNDPKRRPETDFNLGVTDPGVGK
ncbi:MAG TPA: amidohydrolase family protein [Gemmatimonadales bacterium]|jgi:imidazolonepropionase-like amidohydrolase|nr:amidohydrolase family protein [Gemmatimonadales bacterium]